MKKILTFLFLISFASIVAQDKHDFIDRITNEKNWTIKKIIEVCERSPKNNGILDILRYVTKAPLYKKSEQYFLGILQIYKNQDVSELVQDGQLYLISGPKHFAV